MRMRKNPKNAAVPSASQALAFVEQDTAEPTTMTIDAMASSQTGSTGFNVLADRCISSFQEFIIISLLIF